MQAEVASISKGGSGESIKGGSDLAEDVLGVMEHVFSEEPKDGPPQPFEMILPSGVFA